MYRIYVQPRTTTFYTLCQNINIALLQILKKKTYRIDTIPDSAILLRIRKTSCASQTALIPYSHRYKISATHRHLCVALVQLPLHVSQCHHVVRPIDVRGSAGILQCKRGGIEAGGMAESEREREREAEG